MSAHFRSIFIATLLFSPATSFAGVADVVAVEKKQSSNGTWRFSVTVAHTDEGWNHYANSWQVLALDGTVLATRVLAHPHVDEQPFTRSKSGVKILENIKKVIVRAGDLVHGYSGKEMRVSLTD